jgi:hypothetical protein
LNFASFAAAAILFAGGLLTSPPHLTHAQVVTRTPDTTMSPPNPNPVPTAVVPAGNPGVLPDTPNTPNMTTAAGILVRRELWAEAAVHLSASEPDLVKVPRRFVERLTDTLCYAA